MKKPRLKRQAAVNVPQTREAVIADIKTIGDRQRELMRIETLMNDEIGVITEKYSSHVNALKTELSELESGVHKWSEANRSELTNDGKTKTANLTTGEVSWRTRPPSVRITDADSVIKTLYKLNLEKFVREKREVNKEAILSEPEAVAGIAGIKINSGIEDFIITPFEQQVITQ